MLKIITTLSLFLIGMLAKGQEVENRTLSSFSKVEVKNGIELIYNENKTPSLRIEAENLSVLKNVITEVKGKTLKIYLLKKENQNEVAKNIKVYLSFEKITSFAANSKAKITVIDPISAENLAINLKSEGQFSGIIITKDKTTLIANSGTIFNGRVETTSFVGNFENNSKINLSGKTEKAIINASDSSLLEAKNFVAANIVLNASGKSLALIYVEKAIAITVADEAKVSYTGYPEKINLNDEAESFQKNSTNKQLVTFNY